MPVTLAELLVKIQLIDDLMSELGLQRRGKNILVTLTTAIRTSRSRRHPAIETDAEEQTLL